MALPSEPPIPEGTISTSARAMKADADLERKLGFKVPDVPANDIIKKTAFDEADEDFDRALDFVWDELRDALDNTPPNESRIAELTAELRTLEQSFQALPTLYLADTTRGAVSVAIMPNADRTFNIRERAKDEFEKYFFTLQGLCLAESHGSRSPVEVVLRTSSRLLELMPSAAREVESEWIQDLLFNTDAILGIDNVDDSQCLTQDHAELAALAGEIITALEKGQDINALVFRIFSHRLQ